MKTGAKVGKLVGECLQGRIQLGCSDV